MSDSSAIQADRVEAAARQQEQRVAQTGAQAQQGRAAQVAQVHRIAGARRQHKELDAQAVMLAVLVLLDHLLRDQSLQGAVHGGLRQADGPGNFGHARALRLGAGQQPDDGKSALQCADTGTGCFYCSLLVESFVIFVSYYSVKRNKLYIYVDCWNTLLTTESH